MAPNTDNTDLDNLSSSELHDAESADDFVDDDEEAAKPSAPPKRGEGLKKRKSKRKKFARSVSIKDLKLSKEREEYIRKSFDEDGNGVLSMNELGHLIDHDMNKTKDNKRLRLGAIVVSVALILVAAATFATSFAAVKMNKEVETDGSQGDLLRNSHNGHGVATLQHSTQTEVELNPNLEESVRRHLAHRRALSTSRDESNQNNKRDLWHRFLEETAVFEVPKDLVDSVWKLLDTGPVQTIIKRKRQRRWWRRELSFAKRWIIQRVVAKVNTDYVAEEKFCDLSEVHYGPVSVKRYPDTEYVIKCPYTCTEEEAAEQEAAQEEETQEGPEEGTQEETQEADPFDGDTRRRAKGRSGGSRTGGGGLFHSSDNNKVKCQGYLIPEDTNEDGTERLRRLLAGTDLEDY